jgi:uncharacterized sulfatase
MSRRQFLRRVGCALLALAAVPRAEAAQPRPPAGKPNVLLIMVDDLNTSLSCYGHSVVKTPNLDRLARRGMRFDRAYCQYPLCNPSRASLLSGLRPDSTKVLNNTTPPRQTLPDAVFLPDYFRMHGYFTARVGKIFHGTYAETSKWDVSANAGGKGGKKQKKDKPAPVEKAAQKKEKKGGGLPITWRATDRNDEDEPDGATARRIVKLLEQNKDRPFFIAAGFHKPHLAFIAPKRYFAQYPSAKIALPKEPAGVRKGVPPLAFTHNVADDKMSDDEKRQAVAAYYACVSFIDAQVGLILDALDSLGLGDNTLVIFVSDHGFHLSEHGGLWRKMTLFEESARVPLIVAGPGVRAGAACPRTVELVDLYPTLADYCKLPAPKQLEGASLVPLLRQPDREWRRPAFTVVSRAKGVLGRSVRTERYRYTEWGDPGAAELYDHQTDPREWRNLANDPSHARTVEELRRLLRTGASPK